MTVANINDLRLVQMIAQTDLAAAIIDSILKDGTIDHQISLISTLGEEYKTLEGCTALHIAIQHSIIPVAQRLLQHGADFTIQHSFGETALHVAIFRTYFTTTTKNELNTVINAILDTHAQHNIYKNPRNKNGLTHFHAACLVDHEAAVKFFIEKGVSLNRPVHSNSEYVPGYTPLHLAVKYGRFRTFKTLLNHGADVTLKNADGLSPLHMLIERNMVIAYWMEIDKRSVNYDEVQQFKIAREMIKSVLKKYENNKDGLLDDTGLSYFHVLCTLQNISLIDTFMSNYTVDLQHSVKTDSYLWPGYTALHFAAKFSIETVKVLIKHGANIRVKDAKGVTPFNLYLQTCKVEDIHFIVKSQPDWEKIMLSDGETSLLELLDAMRSENSLEIFIQRVGANTSVPMNSSLWSCFTPLHLAIRLAERVEGDEVHTLYMERIRILLNAGADVNSKDSYGSTPIHVALFFRKDNVVNLLLQTNQLILDHVDWNNLSHLQIACATCNLRAVRNMLQGNVNINLPLSFGQIFKRTDHHNLTTTGDFFTAGSTPLHMAVIRRSVEIARLLVDHGADVHAVDDKGLTPIHRLLGHEYRPDVAAIGRILLSVDDLRDVVTSFGLSHLHLACWVNHKTAVEKFFDQGVNVNVCLSDASKLIAVMAESKKQLERLPKRRIYPLDFAFCRKQSNVMDLIFRRGEFLYGEPRDILNASRYTTDSKSFDGFFKAQAITLIKWVIEHDLTRLHVACYQLDVDAVEEQLRRGADPNARVSSKPIQWYGMTPLHLLMDNPFKKDDKINAIAKLLIDYGADVTIADPKGDTVIHRVVNLWGFREKQTLLLLLNGQKNFDVNPRESTRGVTHFVTACIVNASSVVDKFLQRGVDVNQTVDSIPGGSSPLHLAAFCNAKETVDVLLKHGADVHAWNLRGETALHCAVICEQNLTDDRGICEPLIMSLLSAGAEVDIDNNFGETPLEVLLKAQKASRQLLKILSENHRCVNVCNELDGRGFIATAIKRLTKIKNIVEHPVYQAVIDSPTINQVDDRGQTPIHNIVSIRKIAASIEVYTKAIERFLNVGFDIDQRNEMDETALYVAVYFRNAKAVAALLALGANVNSLCGDITPFSFHWESCRGFDVASLLGSERQMIKSFAKQVYKLHLINFHVNEINEAVEAELQARQWYVDLKTVEQCQVELERLETRKIGRSDISWWSFLSETGVIASFPTMRQFERQAIRDVFEKQSFRLRREFPEFSGILNMQYRKAVARMSLIDPSKDALSSMLNFSLPDLCSDRVLRFLENADLVNLIQANENPVTHAQKLYEDEEEW